jgi:hypothetical protein
MPSSGERVNFAVRPAKYIERKMLMDVFRRIALFTPLDRVRYIGMGSVYFTDFILVHKTLGINDMVSFEQDTVKFDRFRFNRPYRCIKLRFGTTYDELPNLEWNKVVIAWLDYDGVLDGDKIGDVELFLTRARPGSMLVVTVNVHFNPRDPNAFPSFRDNLGPGRLSPEITDADLIGPGMGDISIDLIRNQVDRVMMSRNSGLSGGDRLRFERLVNFRYADGAKMATFGGMLIRERDNDTFKRAGFPSLGFYRNGADAFQISPPMLTLKELRYLDSQLPGSSRPKLRSPGVSSDDVEDYGELYRYFPTFADAEMP